MTATPRTPTTEATASSAPAPATTEQAASYQRLRAHLAYLKLPTAAQVLPEVLDAARTEQLSPTALLERLLQAEVNATEQRRLTGRLRFASLPAPRTLEDLDSVHTAEELARVQVELNDRPRKILKWDTPASRMTTLLETPSSLRR